MPRARFRVINTRYSTLIGNWLRTVLTAAGLALLAAPSFSSTAGFSQCVAQLMDDARSRGISTSTVDAVLAGLEHQPRVIELDRAQPEFNQTFAAYLRARVTPERVRRGRELLVRHEALLSRLTRQYGVPGRYLIAFWGLETNFGSYLGNMPTLDSLATLACDQRRAEYFSSQLFMALELLERESLTPQRMRGSWAGAMGHTQFMPAAYLEYAIDGDGDGRIDLWASESDALASAAHYLHSLGWNRGERWGREVRLPGEFPWHQSGLETRKQLAEWRDLGARKADGGALPVADIDAALLLPMGHRGPAFLVYPNFDVIMQWNRSQSYALSVGHLADRLAGGGELVAPLREEAGITERAQLISLQRRLSALGFNPGAPDGILGPATRAALRAFQQRAGLPADGYPTQDTLNALQTYAE